jgi:guanosine-3',5'-bis(diphosphate) 3'-pyrophosphohydrolase
VLRFNDIADRVLEYAPDSDLELLQRAYVFTAKVHKDQKRHSGEPYLIHPLEVAGILVEMRLDALTIAAGLLHDTVEDTLATLEEIEQLFGEEVAFLVEGLTKIAKVEFTSARERQAENFRKMLVAMSKDIRILLIKLVDRLHNMRTIRFLPEDKGRRVAQETLDIYVPLAHRLGIYWMKRELEEHAFRTLHAEAAAELERVVTVRKVEREGYVAEVKQTLQAKLDAAGLAGEVAGRVKDLSSIHAKMEKQSVTLEKIYDLVAFRIILEADHAAVYHALGLVHATWPPVPGRFKDYVALPKANGYQSLHTTVIGPYGERMEIQIRTRRMHELAEMGIAAHWRYKGHAGDARDDQKFAWLRQLLERQTELADPHEFLDVVKVDIFPDEVFVFTPKGDVFNLPTGATALDFAYAIHSQVGDRCTGARVNGMQRPLHHELASGDTVEILTNAQQRPKKDWLEFAISGKARSRIRHAVREEENAQAREIGRGVLDKALRRAGISLARTLEDGKLDEFAVKHAKGVVEDLFAAIHYGRLEPGEIVKHLRPDWRDEAPVADAAPAPAVSRLRSVFGRRDKAPTGSGIRVNGHNDVLVRMGQCCSPIPGDEITGFVTIGRGVTVHTRDCRAIFALDPSRRIDVEWDMEAGVPRQVAVRVKTRDEPGVLAKLTKVIATSRVNIGGAQVTTHEDRTATHAFDLWVTDAGSLNALMKEWAKVKGVHSVERVRS